MTCGELSQEEEGSEMACSWDKTAQVLTGRPGGPAGPRGPVPPDIPCNKPRDVFNMRIVFIHWIMVVELLLSNRCERGHTYRLSLWSGGSLRPRQTSVSLLSLLSWGSNETDKTWVSLLSLGTGVSTQTSQTRRSLQEEKKRKKRRGRERGWETGRGKLEDWIKKQ